MRCKHLDPGAIAEPGIIESDWETVDEADEDEEEWLADWLYALHAEDVDDADDEVCEWCECDWCGVDHSTKR